MSSNLSWLMAHGAALTIRHKPSAISHQPCSVVVLLLPRRHADLLVDHRLLAPCAATRRGGFGRRVAALFTAADLFLRVQALEDEIDGRCDGRSGSAGLEAGVRRKLPEPLNSAGLSDHIVG